MLLCCLVDLHPRETALVTSEQSVNLTTLSLGRLRPPKLLISTKLKSCMILLECVGLSKSNDLQHAKNACALSLTDLPTHLCGHVWSTTCKQSEESSSCKHPVRGIF